MEDIFDFSTLDENHELISNKHKKVFGLFQLETPKTFWVDEFICLRSKACSFGCKDDTKNKNKLKSNSKSQSKHIKFEEYKKC